MLARRPDLPKQMKGGPDNPLGPRAHYLYRDGKDLIYRIHGTTEPWSIGTDVSSGAAARMRTKTFGAEKQRLVHDCSDASCKAQNRRVVTVLESETGI